MNKLKSLLINCLTTIFIFVVYGCASSSSVGPVDISKATELVDKGSFYLEQGKLDEAERSFRLALEIQSIAAAYDGLGCVEFLRRNFTSAASFFKQAYEMDKSYSNSLGNLALLYEVTGHYQLAQETYERALQEDPKNFKVRNNYAAFLVAMSKRRHNPNLKLKAEDELKKAKLLISHPLIEENIKKLEDK